LGSYGNVYAAFSANGFALPRFARRCREFELRAFTIAGRRSIFVNRSPAFETRSSGLVGCSSHCDTRSSQLKCSRSGLGNGSSVLKTRPPVWDDRSSGISSRSSERHRLPPFSNTAPPISGTSSLLHNLLIQGSLHRIAAKRRRILKNPFVPFAPFRGQI
jgi:hypothetical protein